MATSTTTITTATTAGHTRTCWECGRPVAYEQNERTMSAWRAIICFDCAPWVAGLLGPLTLPTGDRHQLVQLAGACPQPIPPTGDRHGHTRR